MTAKLTTAQDAIRDILEALTPLTDTRVTYHEVDGRTKLDGVSGRRAFWWDLDGQTTDIASEIGRANSQNRTLATLVVRLSTAGLGPQGTRTDVADEQAAIANAIDFPTSWATGIDLVQVQTVKTRRTDSDDLELVFTVKIDTQEL